MCGIAGYLQTDGAPPGVETLRQMIAALGHRGPDGRGMQVLTAGRGAVGLAHARLRVIDLSAAADQPMTVDGGRTWIVFNGEIYNFRELRAELAAEGIACTTASDTEVILRLYAREGEGAITRLDGMFALAIWDGERLLLARDRAGKKPLFYGAEPRGGLVFASEIKALLRHPAFEPELDRTRLPAFFFYGYVPSPDTLYRGVRQLPPGHLLTVDRDGRAALRRYWELPVGRPSGRVREADAAARVRELLTEAVRRRLIADVPLGAFLSGGLDSSVIVALMSRLTDAPVRTFSIGFEGDARFDETRYARLVAERYRTVHTEFVVKPDAVALVERLVWHHDGPFGDSSALPTYLLAQLTRQHVTVALSGDGGDELFAGYLRFAAGVVSERLPAAARHLVWRVLGRLPERGGHRSAGRFLRKFAESLHLPLDERFSRWSSIFADELPALLGADVVAAHPPARWRLPHTERCQDASLLQRLLYMNFTMYLPDDLLVKMDRCTMAHALEARSPFLDTALTEYVAGLPDAYKLRGGRTKVILRRACADLVPREILRRGKMGFGVPLRRWFDTDLRGYVHEMLLSPGARLRSHLDQEAVRRLCEEQWSGREDHSHGLWTLLTFEVWLRQLPQWRAGEARAPHGDQPVAILEQPR